MFVSFREDLCTFSNASSRVRFCGVQNNVVVLMLKSRGKGWVKHSLTDSSPD